MKLASGGAVPISVGMAVESLVFVSGQLAILDGVIKGDDIGTQTRITFAIIAAILCEMDLGMAVIARQSSGWARVADFAAPNAVYRELMSQPFRAPSTVVSELLPPGSLVEIEVIAQKR